MSLDAGRPIRSDDLLRGAQEGRAAYQALDEGLSRIDRRVRMAALALKAAPERRPRGDETAAGSTAYLTLTPGTGAGQIGPFTAGQRLSGNLLLEAPQGEGDMELLAPSMIWAGVSASPSATFEARVEPARLLRCTEIMLPHVAGSVALELFTDSGSVSYGPFEESRLIRTEPIRFNGRLRVSSTSQVTSEEGYLHAMGGLELRDATWTKTYEASAKMIAPRAGQFIMKAARLHPNGLPVSPAPQLNGVPTGSDTFGVSQGDEIAFALSGLDGSRTASFLALDYQIR